MSGFPYSAHIGYLFTDRPMAERIAAATRCGFTGVEHPAPYAVPATDMAGWLKSAGAHDVQFGLYSGDASKGETGLGIFPDRRDELRATVLEPLEHAAAAAAPRRWSTPRRSGHRWCMRWPGSCRLRSGPSTTGTATSRTSPSPPPGP